MARITGSTTTSSSFGATLTIALLLASSGRRWWWAAEGLAANGFPTTGRVGPTTTTALGAYRSLSRGGASRRVSVREVVAANRRAAESAASSASSAKKGTKKSSRTRRRSTRPRQTYAYASARKRDDDDDDDGRREAERLGWSAARQQPDPIVGGEEPVVVAEIELDAGGEGTTSHAYVLRKPSGWSILAGKQRPSKTTKHKKKQQVQQTVAAKPNREANTKRVGREHATNKDDDDVVVNAEDVLALLTPEELAAMTPEERADLLGGGGGGGGDDDGDTAARERTVVVDDDDHDDDETACFRPYVRPSLVTWLKDLRGAAGRPMRGGRHWIALAGARDVDDSGLVLLCPRGRADDLLVERTRCAVVVGTGRGRATNHRDASDVDVDVDVRVLSRLKRGRDDDPVCVATVETSDDSRAFCADAAAVVRARLGDGARGDPNGDPFDLRAPRRLIHCDALSVVNVVDGRRHVVLCPTDAEPRNENDEENDEDEDDLSDDDEDEDRYSASSLSFPLFEPSSLPDDMAVYFGGQNRDFARGQRNGGSFFGRSGLRRNPSTTAYREINGAADGHPGWIVDRYDQWLFVQHDRSKPRGPLPSIHDGNTRGVYYFGSDTSDRSDMASVKPRLTEGTGPDDDDDAVVVVENGVRYLVRLSERLSTGVFLDQRPGRAWLSRNCDERTRVLNCFAHAGAYGVAAAVAGASTVAVDLDARWLDRIGTQLALNGVATDDDDAARPRDRRHDRVRGDCFDWLRRFVGRGERFDVVILDPPSTSVGTRKKRWSVKRDMAELVELATPLVKNDGLLWTTNNCATLPSRRFANACRKGLVAAGAAESRLERFVPMPQDFPSIGSQPVTNIVWRVRR